MKFCIDHWERLKTLIKEAGLYKYVSDGGEALAGRLQKELKGEFVIPDPLLTCHNNLVGFALENGGMYLMGRDENGSEYCPMCECKRQGIAGKLNDHLDEQWMNAEVGMAKKWFESKGLLNDN